MAITYESAGNNIFLDPDLTTEDTYYTMDDVVTAFPVLVTKQNETYFIAASIVVAGTSTSRAVLTAQNITFYFTDGVLGNDGGRLSLGEKVIGTEGTFTRNGCFVVFDNSNGTSIYRDDPYKNIHSFDRTTDLKYPLCGEDGEIYIYASTLTHIGGGGRSDSLDSSEYGVKMEMIDVHIDGDADGGASNSYTHLFLRNTKFENVKISNFGTIEFRKSFDYDWVGLQLLQNISGISGFGTDEESPVRLKDLVLQGVNQIGKKVGMYLELIDLDYKGDNYIFNLTSGWCKLKTTVQAKALYDGVGIEGARLALSNNINNVSFNELSDVDGNIIDQESITRMSSNGSTTFDKEYNPFKFIACSYGKTPISIPVTLQEPNITSLTGSFLDLSNITKTAEECSLIDVEITENKPLGVLIDGDFNSPISYAIDGTEVGIWYAASTDGSDAIYTNDGKLYFMRDSTVEWNSGRCLYQTIDCVIGTKYTLTVVVDILGDGGTLRMGLDSYYNLQITEVGTYTYTFTASKINPMFIFNTSSGYGVTEHTVLSSCKIIAEGDTSGTMPDLNGNPYSYSLDCKGLPLNDVYHALHYQWSIVKDLKIYSIISSGLILDGSGNYYGGQGILFSNFSGNLSSITSDNGISYYYPIQTLLKLYNLKIDTEIRIYRADDLTELAGVENSSDVFNFTHTLNNVDVVIVIHNLQYTPIRLEMTLDSNDISIPISQVYDRTFI